MVLVGIAWGWYLASIPRNTVPARPVLALVLQATGATLGIWAIATESPQWGVLIPSGFAIGMAVFFVFLLAQRKTPIGKIRVKVGEDLLPFSAKSSDGTVFDTEVSANQRVLFKFFRGAW